MKEITGEHLKTENHRIKVHKQSVREHLYYWTKGECICTYKQANRLSKHQDPKNHVRDKIH